MRQIADYRLDESLGCGTHGEFYRAHPPPRLDLDAEWVAVKVMEQNASDDAFRRFANEIKLFAAVDSPHLVRLHDAGHQNGKLFYAAEYFPLGSLGSPSRQLTDAEKLRAVADAAHGAHALHTHEPSVAHRNVKPENIMLHESGAKLGDLGLAQTLEPGLKTTGTGPIGPIEFMPPRMARGDRATSSTDVWALGATLHRVLTGESVYGKLPTASMLKALLYIIDTEPRPATDLDPLLFEIINSCMAAQPGPGSLTAEAVAEHIEALL